MFDNFRLTQATNSAGRTAHVATLIFSDPEDGCLGLYDVFFFPVDDPVRAGVNGCVQHVYGVPGRPNERASLLRTYFQSGHHETTTVHRVGRKLKETIIETTRKGN